MKSTVKHVKKDLIGVVMDGITDTSMIAEYAESAREEGEEKLAGWFSMRAKERLAMVRRDWTEVEDVLKLKEHGDELVQGMRCHIHKEIDRLANWIEKM